MSNFQRQYTEYGSGEIAGVEVKTQMPYRAMGMVNIKAKHDNAGLIWIGGPDLTVPNEGTDENAGFALAGGEETGWMPADNLNQIWYQCQNDSDSLHYHFWK